MAGDNCPLDEGILFDAALYSENDEHQLDIAEPFVTKLQEEFMEDKTPN